MPFLRAQPTPQAIHLADARGAFLAEQPRQRLVAEPAAGGQRVLVVMAPVVRRLGAERHRDRHLRHHGRAAAADQAAVDQQHAAAGARRLDRGIHAGRAGADHQHIGFDLHRLGHGDSCRHAANLSRARRNRQCAVPTPAAACPAFPAGTAPPRGSGCRCRRSPPRRVLKPPKLAISQPEISGPVQAISRGVLNTKAVAVARTRVGNSSGSQAAIQVYWPDTKMPLNAAAHRMMVEIVRPQEHHRHRQERQRDIGDGHGLAAIGVGEEAEGGIAEDGRAVVGHGGVARPLLRRQAGLGGERGDVGRQSRPRCPRTRMWRRATSGTPGSRAAGSAARRTVGHREARQRLLLRGQGGAAASRARSRRGAAR